MPSYLNQSWSGQKATACLLVGFALSIPAFAEPFTDKTVCVEYSCDQARNCVKVKDCGKSPAKGYALYFNNKLVSGPDAATYTFAQAQQNCAGNMQNKPNVPIRCLYDGQLFKEQIGKSGYQLYFNNQLVSGPDAIFYTLAQAQQNCAGNMQSKPNLAIRCLYNDTVIGEQGGTSPRSRQELLRDIEIVEGNIRQATLDSQNNRYTEEQKKTLFFQIQNWQAQLMQLRKQLAETP